MKPGVPATRCWPQSLHPRPLRRHQCRRLLRPRGVQGHLRSPLHSHRRRGLRLLHGELPAQEHRFRKWQRRPRRLRLNEDSTLHSVTERTRIETYKDGIHYTEDGGESWTDLPGETPVSMNLWGFGESFVKEATGALPAGWTRIWKRTRSSASISCRWWSVSSSAKRKPPSRCCAAPISGMRHLPRG